MSVSFASIKRPIQIAEFKQAIEELDDAQLTNIRAELNNTVRRLKNSNAQLAELIAAINARINSEGDKSEVDELNNPDANDTSDLQLYSESVEENEIVLKNQFERLDAIEQELLSRGMPLTEAPAPRMEKVVADTRDLNSVYL